MLNANELNSHACIPWNAGMTIQSADCQIDKLNAKSGGN